MEPATGDNTIDPESEATEALARMSRAGTAQLMVVEEGRLLGTVALQDLLDFLARESQREGGRQAVDSASP